MSNPSKSKMLRLGATFVVGSFAWAILPDVTKAQEANGLGVFDTGFRGTIASTNRTTETGSGSVATDLQLSQRDQQPSDGRVEGLGAIPVPLSQRNQRRATPVARQPAVFNSESADQLAQQNVPAEPIQQGISPVVDDEPFTATGFRIGIFEANISLEQSAGYSSNISQNVGGVAGGFSQTDADLSLVSDWSRHELQVNLNGSYRKPFAGDEIDQPSFTGDSALRLDLIDGMTLTTSGFYSVETQEFTSTTLAPGAVDTPLVQNYGTEIALNRADRKLQFTLRGLIEREVFEDADLGGGATVSQADLNNTEYGIGLRLGYEVSPAITPFVDSEYSIREFDLTVDRNGNRRDSQTLELRGGLSVDLGEKMRGEISAGYLTEQFEDTALADLSGYSVDGELIWSPQRDTEIVLSVGTETNSSIVPGNSGTFLYDVGLTAEHQINDRWAMNSFVNLQLETNEANNTTFEAGFGLEYWVNRFMAITGDVEYQSFTSETAGADFDEIRVRAGVRLQR